ncbi:MAG TPA: alpha/beta hydrolase [Solirubrobacteraceae bacterium]|jgi:acetyl esterase/lipase|nr:alpha/beta hydrolase [Solirubrobacteraceae bacterium]
MSITAPSIGEQDLLEHYRASNAASHGSITPEIAADQDHRWGDVASEPGGVDYIETTVAGVPALWLAPARRVDDVVLLCLHGGGFIGGSMYTHRRMYAHIAKRSGARALVLNYRQMPDHPHPAAALDAAAAYGWLRGQDLRSIAAVGDSAGGALALGLALTSDLPAPDAVVGLSPWTDMTLSGASMRTNRATDALFGGEHPFDLASMVDYVLGGPDADRRDPRISPLHGDLDKLPPTYLQVSGTEMLLDDAAGVAEAAPDVVALDVFDGQQHTFQMAAGRSPVADDAVARVAAWLRDRLDIPGR